MLSALRDAALTYAGLGFAVVPCAPNRKKPITKHGLKDATTERAAIVSMWSRGSHYNIGLLAPSDVLVLDADTSDAAQQLESRFGELSVAPRHDTPGGGSHFFVRAAGAGSSLRTRTRVNSDLVDIRGLGRAIVIAPPSRGRQGSYVVVRPLVKASRLPWASGDLLAYLGPKRSASNSHRTKSVDSRTRPVGNGRFRSYALAALRNQTAKVAEAAVGTRNDTLNLAAFVLGGMVRVGWLERSEVILALLAAARDAGLPAREIEATLASGLAAGLHRCSASVPGGEHHVR